MGILERDDEYYMGEALREARKAESADEIPVGAVMVSGGDIIGRAHNQTELLHDVTAHAEMLCITAAANALGGKYLTDCTLYVTVEPCPMCAGALGWAQVQRVVYGTADEKRGFRRYAPEVLHARCTTSGGILEEECRRLMKDFFAGRR